MNRLFVARAYSHFRGHPSHFRGSGVSVIAALLLVIGCGSATPGSGTDASTPPADAAAPSIDAPESRDAAPSIDAPPPSPMTFRLSYDPSIPSPPDDSIYVEFGCSQGWVRVIDSEGAPIAIDSDCGICRCDACDGCAVCDCALLIEEIPADDSRDHAWDGVTHPSRAMDGCGICVFDSTLPAGTYTARFCYSFAYGGPQECADEVFDYPSATVVEHVVTDPAS